MSATVFSLASEVESRHWDDVVEGDRLMVMDYLQRARGIAAAWACARAEGREAFVSCEVAAALYVDDRTAQLLVAEARLLVELPALGEAMTDGRLRLGHARVLISELMPVETAIAVEVLAAVLSKVGERTPEQVRGIVRRAIIRIDADAAARRRREVVRGRRVFTSPEPDGMAMFGAYLPAATSMEAYALVDARSRTYDRDDRSADARRATLSWTCCVEADLAQQYGRRDRSMWSCRSPWPSASPKSRPTWSGTDRSTPKPPASC